ncbi:MAG: hypothetical protein NTW75_02805 [Planctomycetales bacterium]|nr:hypothetical protein [Planctomycetales bacterium]
MPDRRSAPYGIPSRIAANALFSISDTIGGPLTADALGKFLCTAQTITSRDEICGMLCHRLVFDNTALQRYGGFQSFSRLQGVANVLKFLPRLAPPAF